MSSSMNSYEAPPVGEEKVIDTPALLSTPLTKQFNIKHPVLLAGMNVAAGPKLAAAVTNAGGLGVIGGIGYTPEMLKKQIESLKFHLKDKNAPFGVDLLLPQVGGSARKTNHDYTHGHLGELVDVIIAEKAKLFVSAVGVPPKAVVDKLHAAGIFVMNMIGAPKHVAKALDAGCDLLCAQGGEGGGHTGDVPTSILLPTVVDLCRGRKSVLTGEPIQVIGAGGIFDGRGLAMALAYGCTGVWVGTRFVATKEAGAPARHKKAVVNAGYHDTVRTIIYTGRPLRVLRTPYITDWEENRRDEIKELTGSGILPVMHDQEKKAKAGIEDSAEKQEEIYALLMGKDAGAIKSVVSAAEVVDEMVTTAAKVIRQMQTLSKL